MDDENSDLCIVEYKPTKPKNKDYNFDDLMQVFAQKICVDFVFNCDCEGVLYYADVKKRVRLPLRENFTVYDDILKKTLAEIVHPYLKQKIPFGLIPYVQSNLLAKYVRGDLNECPCYLLKQVNFMMVFCGHTSHEVCE